ncbi:DUF4132 domain-containing protein [Actinomadura sp. 1N219]|uniref:DUF4132 domain-containing protein n=1 Tax=Actinomadura sp. 1N219 TaxID=3375152 RepID=UPI0037A8D49B
MLYDTLAAEARQGDGLDPVRLAALDRARPLVDLFDRRQAEIQGDGTLWKGEREFEEHVARLTALEDEVHERLDASAEEEGRAALLCLLPVVESDSAFAWHFTDALKALATRSHGWTPGEVAVMLVRASAFRDRYRSAPALEIALIAAERLGPDQRRELAPWLRGADREFAGADVPIEERKRVTRRLSALLVDMEEAHVPSGLIPERGAWAEPLRSRVSTEPGATAEFARFIRHLGRLSSPRPSQKWSRECVALADAASMRGTVAECLRALVECEPQCSKDDGAHADWLDGHEYHYHYLVHQNHGDFARGVVWAAALTGGPETVLLLDGLALRAGTRNGDLYEDVKLAGAAINALGAAADPGALESLWRLQAKIKDRALRKQLDAALRTAAGRQGITPAQLVERSVPSHGLGPDGSLERTLGEHTVRLAVEDAATVRLTFTGANGKAAKTAPAAVKDGFAGELKELKALAKEVRGTLSTERARIEALMSDDRVWPYGEWREHYRDHPITGVIVRGLVWEFQREDGTWHAAMTPPGEPPAHVRLWHPIRATVDGVRAWRERIVDERVRQPFKQAFREIYLLTPAEEETGTYSNRFAAHIVRYRRLYALFKDRGWQANFLGRYDGGYNGEARREFGGGEWRACFYHEPVDDDTDWAPEYASTDQVRFERRQGRGWADVPLAGVPPLVFSEAMRDVDLFVGVTSIAADADWADRGEDRFAAYWRAATFGELTASAEVRRAALERILPRTKIAGRCSLDGRYLAVRGELRTYKIHLGSSNILMEPDDSYLCVVQARGGTKGTPYLPFEDERLSLILSKAFLLAADHKITDETILHQIRRGA